ncbi:MAG: serine/threonine-protein phosphatase 2A activator [bacterium]
MAGTTISPVLLRTLGSSPARFPSCYDADAIRNHGFRRATPDLFTDEDLVRFLSGESAREFVSFVLFLNERVTGTACGTGHGKAQEGASAASGRSGTSGSSGTSGTSGTSGAPGSAAVAGVVGLLRRVASYVAEVPPLGSEEAPNIRFGNPAFRTWLGRLGDGRELVEEALRGTEGVGGVGWDALPGSVRAGVVTELASYLVESFGNSARIDYGTGHETCFVAMLFCMVKVGLFEEEDARDIVLVVFKEYLATVRAVQRAYCLEPAGTRGVWGLDDYQILPFLWGSAQLIGHRTVRPSGVNSMAVVDEFADAYLYMGCVKFIRDIKHGPFHETSPMLFDISGVESWEKINGGMIKMYCAELLAKRQIVQHFLFGSIIQL